MNSTEFYQIVCQLTRIVRMLRMKFMTMSVKLLLVMMLKTLPIACFSLAMILRSLSLLEADLWGFE